MAIKGINVKLGTRILRVLSIAKKYPEMRTLFTTALKSFATG